MSDTAADPNIRRLKLVVIVLGALILVSVAIVVAAIIGRMSGQAARPPGVAKVVPLPAGAKVAETLTAGDRLVLRLVLRDGGERYLIIDPRSGEVQHSIDLITP
jgi:Family of unknown function (DUF6476)